MSIDEFHSRMSTAYRLENQKINRKYPDRIRIMENKNDGKFRKDCNIIYLSIYIHSSEGLETEWKSLTQSFSKLSQNFSKLKQDMNHRLSRFILLGLRQNKYIIFLLYIIVKLMKIKTKRKYLSSQRKKILTSKEQQ